PVHAIASTGSGSRAIAAIPRTNAPMRWRAGKSTRSGNDHCWGRHCSPASWSSGPRASSSLMIMSAQDARGPQEHEKTRHWSGAPPASTALGLRRNRLLLDRLFIDQVEILARAVAGIVAFGQAPHLRLAGAAEVQQARDLAGRALLDLGDAEGDLAA